MYGWAKGGNANSQSGKDNLNGGANDDELNGETGNDSLYGGTGIDTLRRSPVGLGELEHFLSITLPFLMT